MINDEITVVIAARNAAATIGRAVSSVSDCVVLLVDDASTDGTATVARQAKPSGLHVLHLAESRGLGHARQAALEIIKTPYLVWLDADDEFTPDRVKILLAALRNGADLVFDATELFDGHSGGYICTLTIPSFLLRPGAFVRCFERNYLPGPAWPALCTEFARQIGYDPKQTTGDDLDFILRAVCAGGRLMALTSVGYRQFAYRSSLSRNLGLQRAMVKRALLKHDYSDVQQLYLKAGYSGRITAWGLCSMAIFKEEYEQALMFLSIACPEDSNPNEVLETDGPRPVPEGWHASFTRGTLLCFLSRPLEAIDCFETAAKYSSPAEYDSPDLLNNWGTALASIGRIEAARAKFRTALEKYPGYLDARLNLYADYPMHLTSHMLRRLPSRNEY